MEISITQELQCQAVLATRFAQDEIDRAACQSNDEDFAPRVSRGDDPNQLTYMLRSSDFIPEGMRVGEYIYGELSSRQYKLIREGQVAFRTALPIFTGTGS